MAGPTGLSDSVTRQCQIRTQRLPALDGDSSSSISTVSPQIGQMGESLSAAERALVLGEFKAATNASSGLLRGAAKAFAAEPSELSEAQLERTIAVLVQAHLMDGR